MHFLHLRRHAVLCLLGTVLATPLLAQIRSPQATSLRMRSSRALNQAQLDRLALDFEVLPQGPGVTDVIIHKSELGLLKSLGMGFRLQSRGRPFRDILALRQGPEAPPDTKYYTPAEIEQKIDALVKAYPKLCAKVNLSSLPGAAKTHEGRSIFALKISDNPGTAESEPAMLLASQHHARELTTPVIVFHAAEQILKGYATDAKLKSAVDEYEIYCVPCVNPDGVNHVWTVDNWWRKNRRNNGGGRYGVDLNRNFPFLWGACGSSTRTSSDIYRGPSAGSEPETRTMMAFSRVFRPEIYLDFHSSGQEVLFTYAPCATVDTGVRGMINAYMHDLRAPMTYAYRNPSASGEAPEFHWADGQTLSFLIEVNRSFQPAYSVGQAEAARVWPGVYRALTSWRPAVRGRLLSLRGGSPLQGTIQPGLKFSHGEKGGSRARDGRFALWLPQGRWNLSFAAPQHRGLQRSVQVTARNQTQTFDVYLTPNGSNPTLKLSGSQKLGGTTVLDYSSPGDVGKRYLVAFSGGTTPGIPLSGGRKLPLNNDVVLNVLLPPNTLVQQQLGTLDSQSLGQARLLIPSIAALVGLQIHAAGLTLDPRFLDGIQSFSAPVGFKIQP